MTTASPGAEPNGSRPYAQQLRSQEIPWPVRLRVLVLWLITALLMIVALVVRLPLSGQVLLQVGDVNLVHCNKLF